MSKTKKTSRKTSDPARELFQRFWDDALEDRMVYLWGKDYGDFRFEGFAFTQDEHDADNPIKRLPDRPHLRAMSDVYDDAQLLVVVKSRQVMVSWIIASIILWDVLHPGRRWLVTCKMFEDADELLNRMWVQYQQIPEFLRPKAVRKEGYITVFHPNGVQSIIEAAAQNSSAPRSKVYSGVWIDEASFTDNVADLIAAAGPTTMAGGRLIATTTPNGRDYIYKILTDGGRLEF